MKIKQKAASRLPTSTAASVKGPQANEVCQEGPCLREEVFDLLLAPPVAAEEARLNQSGSEFIAKYIYPYDEFDPFVSHCNNT